jgi:hypothetical protein
VQLAMSAIKRFPEIQTHLVHGISLRHQSPTLSKKDMKLVGNIFFLNKPAFSESIFKCTHRHNGMFILENENPYKT